MIFAYFGPVATSGDDRMCSTLLGWTEPEHVIQGSRLAPIMLTWFQIQSYSMYVAIELF
jgi:hypothetical protein